MFYFKPNKQRQTESKRRVAFFICISTQKPFFRLVKEAHWVRKCIALPKIHSMKITILTFSFNSYKCCLPCPFERRKWVMFPCFYQIVKFIFFSIRFGFINMLASNVFFVKLKRCAVAQRAPTKFHHKHIYEHSIPIKIKKHEKETRRREEKRKQRFWRFFHRHLTL